MPFTSDAEFMSHSLTSGLIAAGTSWYLSDVPPDAVRSIWPNVVAGFAILCCFVVWTFPDTYRDPERHPVVYGCFGGVPLLLASYGLEGTAYSILSTIYLWTGGISLMLGISIFVFRFFVKDRQQA